MYKDSNEKLKVVRRFKLIRNLVIIGLLIAALFRFIIGVSKISGFSMFPTLENGDFVMFSRLDRSAKFGDIIALQLPSGEKYVKRVVAVAGDVIDIKEGRFYRNGVPLDDFLTLEEDGRVEFPMTVPEGDVFTLGDNRPESIDSRFYGSVNLRQVQGVLKLRFHGLSVSKMN